jgi:hypothetical protein
LKRWWTSNLNVHIYFGSFGSNSADRIIEWVNRSKLQPFGKNHSPVADLGRPRFISERREGK